MRRSVKLFSILLLTGSTRFCPAQVALFPISGGVRIGFIDSTGTVIIQPSFVITPQFDQANSFHRGRARVELYGAMGYIDHRGNFVWKAAQ